MRISDWSSDVCSSDLAQGQEDANGCPVGGGDTLDRRLRQPGLGQPLLQAGKDSAGGMEALGATAQDGGIAGLEAERAGVGGHVRPALVYDRSEERRVGKE